MVRSGKSKRKETNEYEKLSPGNFGSAPRAGCMRAIAGRPLYSRAAGGHLGRGRDQRKSRPKSVLQRSRTGLYSSGPRNLRRELLRTGRGGVAEVFANEPGEL